MDIIKDFFLNFWQYSKEANIFWSVLTPIISLVAIWLLAFAGLKLIEKPERLRTVFMIHRVLIVSSLLVAMVLVAIICYCWTKNIIAELHLELAFIISLIFAFIVPIVSLILLRGYWEKTKVNEIIDQPVSSVQAQNNIPFINKAFNNTKFWYCLPFIGFLFLLFSMNSGKNIISIVYDNSISMDGSNAISALTQTFGKLDINNEIIFTNLNNRNADLSNCKRNIKDILAIKQSNKIKVGSCIPYNTPEEAKQNFQSTLSDAEGSPICEVTWKMWLFTKENSKANNDYKNKLLIIITDGDDHLVKEDLQQNSKFLFDDTEFAEFYTPEDTHIVDYSTDGNSVVIEKFRDYGATVYPAVTSVDDYLSALDDALLSFQKNIYLIVWTIVICVLGTIIGIVITPKKIAI
jgi:hypothetical protein